MNLFNIHITGVGGQGIGLLSQALLRGIDHAGITALSVDTHGLAQRGGVVVSQIRYGQRIHSPLIMANQADLVLGMERHEALRSLVHALKTGGTLVVMNVSWQPLPVRLEEAKEITISDIESACKKKNIRLFQVETGQMTDSRMHNMAILGTISKHGLVPGTVKRHYMAALQDLLAGSLLEENMVVFNQFAN